MASVLRALFVAPMLVTVACSKSPIEPSEASHEHTLSGTVRDSETGAPVAGVEVTIGRGLTVITDEAGRYAFASKCERDCNSAGYTYFEGSQVGFEDRFGDGDVRLQRMVRAEAGESVAGILFPEETSLVPGYEDNCRTPCKIIRVALTRDGIFNAQLSGDNPEPLLWPRLETPTRTVDPARAVHVRARDDLIVVVYAESVLPRPRQFELGTSFVPD